MAMRELPKGIGTCFRLALQYWFSLTDEDRRRSSMGPPTDALARLAQLDGRRDPAEYSARHSRVFARAHGTITIAGQPASKRKAK